MSLSAETVDLLAKQQTSILCLDTCAILDLMRDITRETISAANVRNGIALLKHAEANVRLTVLIAEQVSVELADHADEIEKGSGEALERFLAQAERIHAIAELFGAQGTLQISHLSGHAARAREAFNRWERAATPIPQNPGVAGRAWERVRNTRSPAKKGKDSIKDCVVIEAYLEVAGYLRSAGLDAPIVFISSNTKEYYEPGTNRLPADLAADFAAVGMSYAPNFGAALHALDIKRALSN